MMKQNFSILRGVCSAFILFAYCAIMNAQMTPYTQAYLQQHKAEKLNRSEKIQIKGARINSVLNNNQVETVQCYVSLKSLSLEEIKAKGGEVNAVLKNTAIVTVPVDSIPAIAELQTVNRIAVSRPMKTFTNQARTYTQAEDVQTLSSAAAAAGLTQQYTGKGVVLGIIDTGIEFNHRAFKDAEGNSRVKAVYLPNATTANGGTRWTYNGSTASGYQYTTASQISNLTCDTENESHGSHTTGCAAGSRVTTTGLTTNVTYGGMAPEADLVLCGCGTSLSETAISMSALYIAEYARQHNQPCVISISLGSNQGPHDGSSSICQLYDDVAEEYGAVILLASGNEADDGITLEKTLNGSDDYMGTIVSPESSFSSSYGTSYGLYAALDIWNNARTALQAQFVVLDNSNNVVYTSSKMSSGSISASTLSSYFSTTNSQGIRVYGGVDSNGRYNLYVEAILGRNQGSYKLGLLVYGANGNKVNLWANSYVTLTSATNSDYTFLAGNGDNSLCDDVTGYLTISVGAIASRLSLPYNYGRSTATLSNGGFATNDIAYFSSYGKDYRGNAHPYITAPGHTVVAPINRYDSNSAGTYAAYRLSVGTSGSGRNQTTVYDYWEYMSGTSMATPVAAGVVALYLQADGRLDVEGVKKVLAETATKDSYVTGTHANRFGEGKINALEGIKYILQEATGIDDTMFDTAENATGSIYDLQGRYVGNRDAVQTGQLPKGIYVTGGRKFVVK